MNAIFRPLFAFVSLLIFLNACSTRPEEASTPSDGMPGEVMVVAEEEALEDIKLAFDRHYHLVDSNLVIAEKANERQYEKHIAFWFTRDASFNGSEKAAPVILLFGEAGEYTSWLKKILPSETIDSKQGFSLQVYRNVWAKPQTVFRLRYGRDIEPSEILSKKGSAFLDSVINHYSIAQGLPGNLEPNQYSDSVSKLIKNNYGFDFRFPPQFRLQLSNNELIWMRQETGSFYRDIFINIFSDTQQINSLDAAIQNRDYFTQKYLKNQEGTKVKISRSNLFPLRMQTETIGSNKSVNVLRGWYQEEGTFRRGPFVRYIFHDTKNKRYIAMDGFVYAPEMNRLAFYRTFDLVAATFKM